MNAQSVGVRTDRNRVLIGERLQYELLINLPAPGYRINFNFPDSVPHFEVIENNNFDTIKSSGALLIHKKIILTSFDSGAWYIPSFEVFVDRDNISKKFNTDPILVNVGYSPADSTGQLRDIKPVMEVTITDYFWVYVAAVALGVIILLYLLYRYFKNRKKKPAPVFHSALSAYEEAMRSLGDLKQYDLHNPANVKEYYSLLAGIFKRYYSRKLGKNLLNKTTGDMLISVKEQQDNSDMVSTLAESLRCADAVKFAKYIPGISESKQSLAQVKEAIELIEKNQSQQKQ